MARDSIRTRSQMCRIIFGLVSIAAASGQTAVDLRTQSKDVDFSAAASTRPFQTGTAIPATCSPGQMFFLTTAPAGSNVYGCTASNIWTLQRGGSLASQLGDFAVTQASSTTLSIGPGCSATALCDVRFGSQVYSLASGGTVTISAGTGVAYIYISSSGALTVGHNLTASCSSGCTAQSGVTAFPLNSIPLFTWSATNGTWNTNGGTDQRAFLSTQLLGAGPGIQLTQTAGQNTVATDPTVVGLRVAAPATSSSPCVAGTWATDGSFYYLCVNLNTWMRAALTSF